MVPRAFSCRPQPLAFLAPSQRVRRASILAVVALHLGIAFTMRNTELLSAAAIVAWLPFLDEVYARASKEQGD